MKKNLIITGGIFHPFSETSDTLSKILNSLGYDSDITLDVEEGIKNINDLPDNAKSGMQDAMEKLEKVKDIGFVHLNSSDVCRHTLVEKIINAYDK